MFISLCLDFCYLAIACLLSPVLLYRVLFRGKYWASLGERLGGISHYPALNGGIWIHGVSVGEVRAARTLVGLLKTNLPDRPILISSTSQTGKQTAASLYPDVTLISLPLDFSWAIAKYFRHFRPALLVLMEWEVWPNLLLQARRYRIPVILLNGRLSEKSFRRYRYGRGLFARLARNMGLFAMQVDLYAQRVAALGVPADKIVVTGNMKFDSLATQKWRDRHPQLVATFGIQPDWKIWIAGSTHAPEEKRLLECHVALRRLFPGLRLILVPRHPERALEVATWVKQAGLTAIRRSEMPDTGSCVFAEDQVIVADRMGELGELYTLASLAFIGGSLIRHGGQNFIEPASLGKAVVCGPFMFNFPEVKLFAQEKALVQLANGDELEATLQNLLANPDRMRALGENAQKLVRASQGSSQRNYELCRQCLK